MRQLPTVLLVLLAALTAHAAPQQKTPAPPRAATSAPGSMAGQVFDPKNKAVPGVLVTLMRARSASERGIGPHPHPFVLADPRLAVRTDAQGRYALLNVPPGEYIAVAIPLSQPFASKEQANSFGFMTTYFPRASSPTAAKPFKTFADRPTVLDLVINFAPIATVSGSVISSSGVPPKGGRLLMVRGDGLSGIGSGTTTIRPDGTFQIRAVSPGTYYLRYAEDEASATAPKNRMPRVSGATVVVGIDGSAVAGVRVEPIKPAVVSGRVSKSAAATADVSKLTVYGYPFETDGTPGQQVPGTVAADGAFSVQTWPGLGTLRVFSDKIELTVVAIRVKGIDVTKTGIEFVAGSSIYDVEVELGARIK